MTEPSSDRPTTPPEAQATGAGQFADSFVLIVVCWSLLICLLAGWDYYQARQSALNNARTAARHSYAKDLTFRKWATGHGGIYAPVSPRNPPNANLAHVPERDIETPSGRPLTLINPAYMLRQIHELADDTFGTRAHITSLRPIRPGNAPDPWEIATLEAFERGESERSALQSIDGDPYLRLMRPMIVDVGCLKCHAAQGYQVDDIRGGISVAIPWAPYRAELRTYLLFHLIGYGGLWSLGMLGIGLSRRRLQNHLAERHQAEVRLRQSEARYHSLFANHHSVMLLVDPETLNIIDANPAAQDYYGYSPEELRGMPLANLNTLPPDAIRAEMEKARQLRRNHFEFLHRLAGGEVREVEVFSGPVEFDGRVYMYSIIHDITPRKEAEARLGHWHELMNYIIEHDPNAIAVLDRNLQFLFVSDRFLNDYRVKHRDIIGKHHYEIFPEIPEKWREVHRRALAGEVLGAEDEPFERDDGRVDYVRWQCRPWHERDGSIGGIVLYTEVITPRKEAEIALEQKARELEERSGELERFNYTVSHDLKSPLVTVKAFLGFLEQDIASDNAERIETDIAHMRGAAEKMGILLDELLEMSRIGRLVNPPEEIAFDQLLQEVLSLMAGPLAEKEVGIERDEQGPKLFGDRPRLLEIWQNLIENAVKYMGDQGAPRIRLGVEETGGEIVFFVRDNGMGIDPRYREKIFGLFEKLDAKSEGSGLGLALVKRIVELYGGRIWVESEGAGKGSCFRFTLPGALHRQLPDGLKRDET
ncbi:PAS domain S-box protein [Trichloromonas acetexigens]|uniref:histidine kinase n=1 Tax=Trichloromonas acetexigens TaxID=38815 RepID=A0A550JBA0_9BACT|nr:PAS domain S-box protein [Desulfuromonas acetexigens]TRO80494.1 PAS domain S-box protein [Desulfuromonas acetexigens]